MDKGRESIRTLCSGFMRENGNELNMHIPSSIAGVVALFYYRVEFDRSHTQFTISEDGLTQTTLRETVKSGRPANQFGPFLYLNDRFECTISIAEGGNSGIMVGFITKGFDEFYFDSDGTSSAFTKCACMAAGNGWFKIDTEYFQCAQAKDRTHDHSFTFGKDKDQTISLSIDMGQRVGKIGKYDIKLPDNVVIVVSSTSAHKVVVVSYSEG